MESGPGLQYYPIWKPNSNHPTTFDGSRVEIQTAGDVLRRYSGFLHQVRRVLSANFALNPRITEGMLRLATRGCEQKSNTTKHLDIRVASGVVQLAGPGC